MSACFGHACARLHGGKNNNTATIRICWSFIYIYRYIYVYIGIYNYLINVRNMAHIKLPTLVLPQAADGGNDLQCRVAVNVLSKQLRAFQGEHGGLAES
jgi:hypothetical protein